ncbi:MAG: hypothetical protein QOC99_3473 [Acidobacteriota bacterium]|nr:hypothetical protein [Acidobacteriota bacterium]
MNPAGEVTAQGRRVGHSVVNALEVCSEPQLEACSESRLDACSESRESWAGFIWKLYPVVLVTLFPVALMSNFWLEVWRGVRSHATDGSGHWGIAQIYNAGIFPDTFGWTGAYFAGMPFPNFYPPLFHWCVGLLQATRLFSFEDAFKLVLVLPVLLMPAAVWLAAWRLSSKNARVAAASACACVWLLVDMHVQTSTCGLDYASTFVAGFYTQPLGFVLLLAWYVTYLGAHRSRPRAAASCVLLALTILANFFNALTGVLLVASTLAVDLLRLRAARGPSERADKRSKFERAELKRALLAHFLTPLVALALGLFWLAPVFGSYEYFVTRPLVVPLGQIVSPMLLAWYAVAAMGFVVWLRKPGAYISVNQPANTDRRTSGNLYARSYLLALLMLAVGVVCASTIAPPWFPLQAFRFLSTLNFLLAVPVGVALSAALDLFKVEIKRPPTMFGVARHACIVCLALVAFGVFQAMRPTGGMAFYTPEGDSRIESVLRFAREHRDGRYLVEALDVNDNLLQPDSPALNAYLGAQGNETLGVVYREASPNSVFFNAVVNAVSTGKDSFGISSVLADDRDFAAQTLARQLERARWLGVRYLVAEADETKGRLAREPAVSARYDFERWSIFELRGEPPPRARVLEYSPALVVSDFSVKGRRQNELDFVRLAEEQFADGWFDVLLARAPTRRIDRLTDLDNFGALVLDTYDCDDETRAFKLLREFAARRTLVLLASDAPLFRRIHASLDEFPNAHVIERQKDLPPGERVESFGPSHHYDGSPVREVWRGVREVLELNKMAVKTGKAAADARTISIDMKVGISVNTEVGKNEMILLPDAEPAGGVVPVLVSSTYSPNWRAREGNRIYAATPFFMLTFVSGPTHLAYARSTVDRAGLWASGLSLVMLCGYVGAGRLRVRGRAHEESGRALEESGDEASAEAVRVAVERAKEGSVSSSV